MGRCFSKHSAAETGLAPTSKTPGTSEQAVQQPGRAAAQGGAADQQVGQQVPAAGSAVVSAGEPRSPRATAGNGTTSSASSEPSRASQSSGTGFHTFVARIGQRLSLSGAGHAAGGGAGAEAPLPAVAHSNASNDDSDDDEEGEDEEEEDYFDAGAGYSSGDDIVEEGATVGSHSGRVLAPITKTTKLHVGVLEGTTFLNQYVVVDSLGRGTYGIVKLCLNTADDTLYAVKAVNKKLLRRKAQSGAGFGGGVSSGGGEGVHDPVEDLKREVEVMRALDHPNLIKLKEVIEDRAGGKVLMVMEYASGGALVGQDQLTPEHHMPEPMAQYYMRQIVAGLAHLHQNRVVHGDLKPENVLLSGDCTLKIADFGQSQFFEKKDTFNRTRGTPAFLPPEVCAGGAYRGRDADMWALGVSLYLFIYGVLPFQAESIADLYDAIATGEVVHPSHVQPSADCVDLMARLLQPDPAMRSTAAETLQHPWIQGREWMAVMPNPGADLTGAMESAESAEAAAVAEDYAAVVFPELQAFGSAPVSVSGRSGNKRTGAAAAAAAGAVGRKIAATPLALVDALLTTNRAVRGRMALRVRDLSRLRTLAARSLRKSSNQLKQGAADLRLDLRPAHSCTSSFNASTGPTSPATPSAAGGASGNAFAEVAEQHPQQQLQQEEEARAGGGGGAAAAACAAGRPAKSALHVPRPQAEQSQTAGPSSANGSNRSTVHWAPTPAASQQPLAPAAVSPEGPFAGAEGGSVPSQPRAGRVGPSPAAGGMPGQAAMSPGEDSLDAFQTVQTAPAGTIASLALQRVLYTAVSLRRRQEGQQQQGQELDSDRQHGQQRQAEGQANDAGREEEGGASSREQQAEPPHLVSLGSAERLTAEAFERMVELMHAAEVAQQAEQGEGQADAAAEQPADMLSPSLPAGAPLPVPSRGGEEGPALRVSAQGPSSPGTAGPPQAPPPSAGGPPPAQAMPILGAGRGMRPGPSASVKELLATSPFGEGFSFALPASAPARQTLLTQLPPQQQQQQQQLARAVDARAQPAAEPAAAAQELQVPGATARAGASTKGQAGEEGSHGGVGEQPGQRGGSLELPTRSDEGIMDPTTGNYWGKGRGKPWAPKGGAGQVIPQLKHTIGGQAISPRLTGENGVQCMTMTFQPGELVGSYLGGTAPIMAYLESGYVDVYYQANLAVPLSTMAALATGLMPGAGAGGTPSRASSASSSVAKPSLGAAEVHSLLLDLDDKLDSVAYGSHLVDVAAAIADHSLSMPLEGAGAGATLSSKEPSLERAQTFMLTVKRATDRAEQLLKNATAGGSIDELLVSRRGPNEFLGALVALDPDFIAGRWKMTVVARTHVQAVVMTKEGLGIFLQHNPLAQVHLRAGLAQSRAEITRLEALEKLASAREHREARRRQAAAEAAARRAAAAAAAGGGSSKGSLRLGSVTGVVHSAASLAGTGIIAAGAAAGTAAGEIAAGVASLDVFGLVSRLRGALDPSQRVS